MTNKYKIVALCLLIISLISTSFCVYAKDKSDNYYPTMDELVNDYLDAIKNAEMSSDGQYKTKSNPKLESTFDLNNLSVAGYIEESFNDTNITLEEAEKKGLLVDALNYIQPKYKPADYYKVMKKQKEFIINEFGVSAWEKVDYKTEKGSSSNQIEKYFIRGTDSEITQQEAIDMEMEYWEEKCDAKGFSYNDFQGYLTGVDGDLVTNEQYYEFYCQYMDDVASEVRMVDKYETLVVYLSFDGETSSENIYDCQFEITNKNNNWQISDGLRWCEEINEDPGADI